MMIPYSVTVSFIVAAAFTVLLPVGILIFLAAKRMISGLPLLLGAAAFFLSQMVLRMPLLSILSLQGWFGAFAANFVPYVLVLSLSAGLFEESARLAGALLLKKQRSYRDVISFGLGHAFCEVILLVGASFAGNAVLCIMAGGGAASILPDGQLQAAVAQLAALDAREIYWGILERFSSVSFHVFATVLVFRGVAEKKAGYYFAAVLTHTLFNSMAVFIMRLAGVALSEVTLLAAALAMGFYVIKRGRYKTSDTV